MEEELEKIKKSLEQINPSDIESRDYYATDSEREGHKVSNLASVVSDMKWIMNEMVQVIAQQQEQIRELQRMNSESEVYGRD